MKCEKCGTKMIEMDHDNRGTIVYVCPKCGNKKIDFAILTK